MKIDGKEIRTEEDFENALVSKASRAIRALFFKKDAVEYYKKHVRQDAKLVKQGHTSGAVISARLFYFSSTHGPFRTQEQIAVSCGVTATALRRNFLELGGKKIGKRLDRKVLQKHRAKKYSFLKEFKP